MMVSKVSKAKASLLFDSPIVLAYAQGTIKIWKTSLKAADRQNCLRLTAEMLESNTKIKYRCDVKKPARREWLLTIAWEADGLYRSVVFVVYGTTYQVVVAEGLPMALKVILLKLTSQSGHGGASFETIMRRRSLDRLALDVLKETIRQGLI